MVDDLMYKVPTPGELVQLIEKQDDVMHVLHDELEACKKQLFTIKGEQEQKYGDLPDQIIEEANSRLETALEALEKLQNENYMLEDEISVLKKKVSDEKPLNSVLNLKDQMKEMGLELERSKRAETNLIQELEEERRKREILRTEFEQSTRTKQATVLSLTEKIEELEKTCADSKLKFESYVSAKESELASLNSEKDLMVEKANQLNSLCEKYAKELANFRRDTAASKSRIAILNQENMQLRTQGLRNSQADPPIGGCSKEISKLLSDQSHLIAALREETKIVTERLDVERKEHRHKVKMLRNEKAELQSRLDKVLRLD